MVVISILPLDSDLSKIVYLMMSFTSEYMVLTSQKVSGNPDGLYVIDRKAYAK